PAEKPARFAPCRLFYVSPRVRSDIRTRTLLLSFSLSEVAMATVNAFDLENAMILVDDPGSAAWVSLETGHVYIRSDVVGELEPLPEDLGEEGHYIPVPGQ